MNGRTVLRGKELGILSLPPHCPRFLCDVGGNAVRFFAVGFSGNSPEIVRDKRGRQKNLVFPGFPVISWLGLRCFATVLLLF